MKTLSILLPFLLFSVFCFSQVIHTFDDPDISQWVIEGDGSISHDATGGNPGGCIFFDDPAAGLVTVMTLPPDYSGQWNDDEQFSFDLLVNTSDPDDLDDFPFLLEISGPGGVAYAWPNYVPPLNEWSNITVPISEASWDVQSGSWEDILQNVNQVRLRIEYIVGLEDVFLDNIAISFTPAFNEISDTVCSDFENYGFDGWTFEDAGSLNYHEEDGNPDGHITVGDQFSVLSIAKAPWKFLGDWSVLGEDAVLNFDIRISTSSSSLVEDLPYMVRIAGGGGEAIFPVDYSEVEEALNAWHTFSVPIDPDLWTVTSGTWPDLLNGVSQLWMGIEFIQGGETILMDNICLYTDNPLTTSLTPVANESEMSMDIFPNPAQNNAQLTINLRKAEYVQILVRDGTGAKVTQPYQGPLPAGSHPLQLNTSELASGLYFIQMRTNTAHVSRKLVVR